jgi:hypothetical protein
MLVQHHIHSAGTTYSPFSDSSKQAAWWQGVLKEQEVLTLPMVQRKQEDAHGNVEGRSCQQPAWWESRKLWRAQGRGWRPAEAGVGCLQWSGSGCCGWGVRVGQDAYCVTHKNRLQKDLSWKQSPFLSCMVSLVNSFNHGEIITLSSLTLKTRVLITCAYPARMRLWASDHVHTGWDRMRTPSHRKQGAQVTWGWLADPTTGETWDLPSRKTESSSNLRKWNFSA